MSDYISMPVFWIAKPSGIPVWAPDAEPGQITIALFTEELFAERLIEDFELVGQIMTLSSNDELRRFLEKCKEEDVSHVAFDYKREASIPLPHRVVPLASLMGSIR